MNRPEISIALDYLRTDSRGIGERHSRIRPETAEKNHYRRRALEGLCGQCRHLAIEIIEADGKNRVALRCSEDLSPLKLYRDTELGEKAKCPEFLGK